MRVVFTDTETPGFKTLFPVELAALRFGGDDPRKLLGEGDEYVERFALGDVPMEWGAMAVHHILPIDLKGCREWNALRFEADWIRGTDYLIGHNIDFDWEVIGKPNIKRICTLALCRYYYPDLDAHKLSAMMYFLFGANEDTRRRIKDAHSALADVWNCRWVFDVIVNGFQGLNTWEEVYQKSEAGRIPLRMTFGKHGPKDGKKGMLISDMLVQDPGYVSWMKKSMTDMDPYLRKALDNPREI